MERWQIVPSPFKPPRISTALDRMGVGEEGGVDGSLGGRGGRTARALAEVELTTTESGAA